MKEQLLAGKKTSTTRYKPLRVGETYLCVGGSRFKAQPFGYVTIKETIPTKWFRVFQLHYKEEGFETAGVMLAFVNKEKFIRNTAEDEVFWSSFEFKPIEQKMMDENEGYVKI